MKTEFTARTEGVSLADYKACIEYLPELRNDTELMRGLILRSRSFADKTIVEVAEAAAWHIAQVRDDGKYNCICDCAR